MTGPASGRDEPVLVTVAEAAAWLHPPISAQRLEHLIAACGLEPAGIRRPPPGSPGGRPARTYDMVQIMDMHAAIGPWLLPRPSVPGTSHESAPPAGRSTA